MGAKLYRPMGAKLYRPMGAKLYRPCHRRLTADRRAACGPYGEEPASRYTSSPQIGRVLCTSPVEKLRRSCLRASVAVFHVPERV
jgi:hypothetical protein